MMKRNLCYCLLLHLYHICIFGYNVDMNFPIIYDDPFRNANGRSSYFGYSVLLSKTWIQIGAPRANFSTEGRIEESIKEPGIAYHCKFDEPCEQLSLGKSLTESHFSIANGSWFGVAMDFQPGVKGNIVVCGHRWINASVSRGIPGACYSFQPDQNLKNISNILTPTASLERDKRFFLQESSEPIAKRKVVAYKYALSQSGVSLHFSQTDKPGSNLLLGAPGFLNWKGSVVKCENLATCTNQPIVIDTYHNSEINEFDLFGYQVSSGHFFSREEHFYVAGAPRDPTMKGYILIYKFPKHNSKLQSILKVSGKTTGEYFGSSIAVADITNDGLDDLVVGAPFFSRNGDEGRIYILEFHKDKTLKKMEYIEGKKEKGRFGTAVASVGDLDHDGFADIAVGAAYEGNGVIYIYYGRSTGLKGPYQRIPAEDIYKSLKGFGNSFSGHVGTDKNYYNGIAVGSFLSGHAVILRTLPVVTVNAYFRPVTLQLSHTVSTAVVGVCVHYTGINVPKLNVTRKISADRSYLRAAPSFVQDTLLLNVNEELCKNYTFAVKSNITHLGAEQNMEFLLSAHITNTSNAAITKQTLIVKNGTKQGYDGFNDQDPVQSVSGSSSEDQLKIPYSQDCKNVCQPDLQLQCFILEKGNVFDLSQPFIIGSTAKYQLLIKVANSGDTSYTTHVEVKFSKEIRLGSMPLTCNEMNEVVNCQFGIVTKNSEPKNITLELDMSSVGELNIVDDQSLYIYVSANTTAKDKNPANNFRELLFNLSLDVDAYLYGKSQKENYPVSKLDNGSYTSVLEVVQIFEIHKKGASPLKMLDLTLKVPVNVTKGREEIQVLSFHKPDGIIDNKYWYCSVDYGCIDCQSTSSKEFEVIELSISEHGRTKRSLLEDNLTKEKAPPSNRTLYINCSSEYVKCTTVRCQTSELEAYGKVTLRLNVDVAKLGPLMGQKDIIYVTSEGKVNILNPDITRAKNIQTKWPHIAEASSPIIGKIPKKKVDLWIIVASIIGGILLAMFVAMGLAKAGFFQRQTKADLQELKEKSRNSQIQPLPIINMGAELETNIELN